MQKPVIDLLASEYATQFELANPFKIVKEEEENKNR